MKLKILSPPLLGFNYGIIAPVLKLIVVIEFLFVDFNGASIGGDAGGK
jgi:hypothetical protein